MTPSGRYAFPALMLGATGIAFAPLFVRLSEMDPTATAFHRVFLALPLLWMLTPLDLRRGGERPTTHRDRVKLLLAGVFFAGDLALWHWSIMFTSIANSTLLANFAPLFVTLGAVMLFKETVSRLFLMGLALALAGALGLFGDSLDLGGTHLQGDLLALAAAVFYAAYLLAVGRLRARFSVLSVMAWTTAGTTLALLPVVLLSGESLWTASSMGWLILLALSWFSHCGGQGLIAFALAHLPAPLSSVSLLVQPVIAAGLGWVWLGEALSLPQALAAAVVLCGIYLARRGSD
ncbi:DMT family transporter [Magnetospira sp. QH-2]|uniref:DMT family transporter n=1 Tax=Magnetospira sp. (strain QH-2) TaxID=1288970 RepID=UPI0003E81AE0|nr:DMT family transporter [Magnetospira sp. QH-2]CCQ72788.1 Putative Multidrug resistance efflux transporter [Magnetospira sp. QH-2]